MHTVNHAHSYTAPSYYGDARTVPPQANARTLRLAVLWSSLWRHPAVAGTSIWLEDTSIVLSELLALQVAADRGREVVEDELGSLGNVVDDTLEGLWNGLLLVLEEEAGEVVASEEILGVVDTACEVVKVDAGVGVDLEGKSAIGSGIGGRGIGLQRNSLHLCCRRSGRYLGTQRIRQRRRR